MIFSANCGQVQHFILLHSVELFDVAYNGLHCLKPELACAFILGSFNAILNCRTTVGKKFFWLVKVYQKLQNLGAENLGNKIEILSRHNLLCR